MTSFEYRTLTLDGPIPPYRITFMAKHGWHITSEEPPTRKGIYIYHIRRVRELNRDHITVKPYTY